MASTKQFAAACLEHYWYVPSGWLSMIVPELMARNPCAPVRKTHRSYVVSQQLAEAALSE
jgi:hypothetical protein